MTDGTLTPEDIAAGWRDIETAPRDGTRILARGGGLEQIEIVDYHVAVGCWNTPEATLDDRDDEADGYNRPAFWMHLPDARLADTPQRKEGEA